MKWEQYSPSTEFEAPIKAMILMSTLTSLLTCSASPAIRSSAVDVFGTQNGCWRRKSYIKHSEGTSIGLNKLRIFCSVVSELLPVSFSVPPIEPDSSLSSLTETGQD